jgi:hypothetical protein
LAERGSKECVSLSAGTVVRSISVHTGMATESIGKQLTFINIFTLCVVNELKAMLTFAIVRSTSVDTHLAALMISCTLIDVCAQASIYEESLITGTVVSTREVSADLFTSSIVSVTLPHIFITREASVSRGTFTVSSALIVQSIDTGENLF